MAAFEVTTEAKNLAVQLYLLNLTLGTTILFAFSLRSLASILFGRLPIQIEELVLVILLLF